MRPNQFFLKLLKIPLDSKQHYPVVQTTKESLKNPACVMDQSKQFQELKNQTGFLNDSLVKLTSKVDSIATHTKMLETQISQVAQQVSTSS